MDDPFGCLQGVKIASKKCKKYLQKRNELHLCPLPKKIDRCPSCEEELFYVVNEFWRECPKCCRVFEGDNYDEQLEVDRGRIFYIENPITNLHLKNVFRKWNINEMFSCSEFDIISDVIAQFKGITGKSVNYPCFLYNYFEVAPYECWPNKKEIMESISHHLPKTLASRRCAKQEFEKWWSNN